MSVPRLLPDAPDLVHGIVRTLDGSMAIQCDGCGRLDTHESLGIDGGLGRLIITSRILFRDWKSGCMDRLCPECGKARGFEVRR